MIIKASQRGGGKQLGLHLLRSDENEHVAVHEMRGFVSDDVVGALKEAYAVSKGTRCKQFLFSVSFNPPQDERVDIKTFENTINRLEERNKLIGQPRIIVFHEKEGRRHAHCVWSRINADTMTAQNLSHFKAKCRDLSREVYLEQGWKLPRGLMNSKERDPRNFTLAEWQQAKRQGLHTRNLQEMMAECWAASDSRRAFAHALEERGMTLAKGDRRGHVAVTHDGAVLSIARYAGVKAKDVRARLGEAKELPDVETAKQQMALQMRESVKRHIEEARSQFATSIRPLEKWRQGITSHHRDERSLLSERQEQRWRDEQAERALRLQKGVVGIWQRLTGKVEKIRQQNTAEAYQALLRDRQQTETLISQQLAERQRLQREILAVRRDHAQLLLKLRDERKQHQPERLKKAFARPAESVPAKSAPKPPAKTHTNRPSAQGRLKALRERRAPSRSRSRDGPDFGR
ncbi:MAG: relaxase [Pseudomonadota bacterium]